MLDRVLQRNDSPGLALRTIYDAYNDEELTLSKEELRVLMNIQQGNMPDVNINPHEDLIDWYSNEVDPHPMHNGPEPKRRFMPSKWEEKKIVKLVRCAGSSHSASDHVLYANTVDEHTGLCLTQTEQHSSGGFGLFLL